MQPLNGLRVVALEAWAVLPAATAILADWGAEVIKVEQPQTGDPMRGFQIGNFTTEKIDLNPLFEPANRNKKSMGLDAKTPGGREALEKLLATADVFTANVLPESLERMDLTWERLEKINPGLVFVHVTGYPTDGPDANRPAYDLSAYWAESGVMSLLGEPDAPPVTQRPGMGDFSTSMMVVAAMMGALWGKEKTGKGTYVNVNLLDTALWTVAIDVHTRLMGGPVKRESRKTARNPLYNCYQCKDGAWIQLILIQTDRFWDPLREALGRPGSLEDPDFATHQLRLDNSPKLIATLDEIFKTATIDEWAERFEGHDLFWGRVKTVYESVEAALARGQVEENVVENEGVRLLRAPARFADYDRPQLKRAPEVGEHTEQLLLDLGYTWDDIVALKEERAIV